MSTLKKLSLLSFIFLLQGCVLGTSFLGSAAIISGTSFVHTQNLPTDTIAEAVTGYDCSFVRQLKDGGTLCRNPHKEYVEAPRYCYRELGTVTCYNKEDPYNTGAKAIAQ